MRAILFGVLSVALLGCSNGNTRVQVVDRKPPPGWHGSYLIDPSAIEANQSKAYSQIIFLSGGRAQLLAHDREYPGWGWSASLSVAPDKGRTFRVRCEAVVVFHAAKKSLIVYQQTRGEAGKYFLDDADNKATAAKLLESTRVNAVVPSALRACEDAYLEFHPKVLEGGEVILEAENDGLRFFRRTRKPTAQ